MSTNSARLRLITYRSPFGDGILVWLGKLLIAHGLPDSNDADSVRALSPASVRDIPRTSTEKKLIRQFEDYFSGNNTAFDLANMPIDRSRWTPFKAGVAAALAAIPYGTTISYAELAVAAGHPRACRAVGNLMAANTYPLIIPCHRVVKSDGSPGSFSAGAEWKVRLLKLEGLPFPVAG
jgi:methylated-DNA-[protein]-cysteine S-methyltransferase